jgi:hypothetical protein
MAILLHGKVIILAESGCSCYVIFVTTQIGAKAQSEKKKDKSFYYISVTLCAFATLN